MFYRKLTDFFHESIVSAPAHAGEKGEVAKNQHKAHSHGAPSPAMKSHCFVCKTLNTVLESTYIGSFSSDFPQSNEIQFLMFHSGIGAFFKKGTPYWQVNCVSGLTYRVIECLKKKTPDDFVPPTQSKFLLYFQKMHKKTKYRKMCQHSSPKIGKEREDESLGANGVYQLFRI